MRISLILLISILFLFSSCNKDKIATCQDCDFTCLDGIDTNVYTNECRDNWTCSFNLLEQSKISTEEGQGVVSGDKTVFQMIRSTEGDPMIADDEFTEILVFEIPSSQERFSEDASELSLQVNFKRVCFCANVMFNPIVEGCLQGEKQEDGTWFVQAYLDGDVEFGIDAQFLN